LGPTQPHIQWLWGVLSPEVKRPVFEADHSLSSSAEIKNAWSIPLLPHTPSWRFATLPLFGLLYSLERNELRKSVLVVWKLLTHILSRTPEFNK
jgi:hypothetical protein